MAFFFLASSLAFSASPTRLNLVTLGISGYDKLKDVKSYLDVAVEKQNSPQGPKCVLLSPRAGTRAARHDWAPFDFYTNVLHDEEQRLEDKAGRLGEADIFFAGDNNNRNGGTDSHEWTRRPTDSFRLSMDFLERIVNKDWFSFAIEFTRGKKIHYKRLVSARTWLSAKKECKASVFDCTDTFTAPDGTLRCHPTGWTRILSEVVAEASTAGYTSDVFFRVTDEKAKNDVASVSIWYDDLDALGRPLGKPYLEQVAPPK